MEQDILGKLKDLTKKFKKDSVDIDDVLYEDESTGDIDIELFDEDEVSINDTIGTDLRSGFENDLENDDFELEEELALDDEELDDEEDDNDDNNEELSPIKRFLKTQLPFIYKLISKKKPNESTSDDDDDDDDDYDDDDEPKKKRKLNLVQVFIIIAVVFFVMEFLFPEEDPSPEPVLKEIKKTQVVNKPVEPKAIKPKPEPTPREVVNIESAPSVESSPEPDPVIEPVVETTRNEGLDNLFKEENTPSEEPMDEPVPEEDIAIETNDSNMNNAGDTLSEMDASISQASNGDIFDDGIIDEVIDSSNTPNITDSILKSLQGNIKENKKADTLVKAAKPTNPPEYDMVGRGLVYNCAGKHWACIDSVSFKKCADNLSWNTQNGSTIECHSTELYESIDDCAAVQQFKIDNIANTDFCD